MKFAKPLLVVGLMFALGSVVSPGCTSGDGGGSDGDGGGSGGDGGDSGGSGGGEAGKGGSASGGKGGSGGSASGGSGGSASGGGGGGGSSVGGNAGASGGSGGMNAAGAGGMNTAGAGGMNTAGAAGGGTGGTVAVAAKFKTDIVPILTAKCGNACHGGQYVARPLARLKENTSGSCGNGPRVVAMSAATSPVVKKVKGTADACGMRRMPLVRPAGCNSNECAVGCTGDACLSADQIAKLESWINAGAKDD